MKNRVRVKKYWLIGLVLSIVWLAGCRQRKPALDFERLAMQMPQQPDSVLQQLQEVTDLSDFSEADRALYYVLLTEAQDKCYVEHTSDSLISWAADYFQRKDDRVHYAKALYLKGRVCQDLGKVLHAQDCYQKALKYSRQTDYSLSGRICNHLGLIYLYHNLYDKSLDFQKEAVLYFQLEQDTVGQIYALRDCARVLDVTHQVDSAEQYYIRAVNLMPVHTVPSVLTELGSIYLEKKDYDRAHMWISQAMEQTKSKRSKYTVIYVLGALYTEIGQTDSAYVCFQQCAESAPLPATRSGAYLGLAHIAESRSLWKEATDAYRQHIMLRDSLEAQKKTDELHESNGLYLENELLLSNLRASELDRQNLFMSSCVIVLLLFCLILTTYYMHRKRTYRIIQDLNQQQIARNEMIIGSLQSVQEYETIHREEMTGQINTLKEENERLKRPVVVTKSDEQLIESFRNPVGWNPDNYHWTRLQQIVDKRHPLFGVRLHQRLPLLTEKELRLCYLLKIKVRPASIALLFANTATNVSMMRKRLYESMSGEKGSAKQFDEFIENI